MGEHYEQTKNSNLTFDNLILYRESRVDSKQQPDLESASWPYCPVFDTSLVVPLKFCQRQIRRYIHNVAYSFNHWTFHSLHIDTMFKIFIHAKIIYVYLSRARMLLIIDKHRCEKVESYF